MHSPKRLNADLSDPRDLQAILDRHAVRAAKGIGQHFLVDRGALAAIIEAAEVSAADDVLEIGPGPGVLTAALADRARSVTAVELDQRMVSVLTDTVGDRANVRIIRADALEIDLYSAGARPTRIVANLPYQITSPLLMKFLEDPRRAPLIVVLVQEEVARRIVAQPGDAKERGFLSVFVQTFAAPRIVRRVPARSFRPPPKVDSAIVALRAKPAPAFDPLDGSAFLALVSDAFRHRRKQLRSALGFEAAVGKEQADAALRAAGIAATRRPEELSVAEWVALATAIGQAR